MNWRDVWVLYRSELRGALRERTIVVNSLLIPLLMYPGMIFLALTGFTVVQSQTEGFISRIVVADLPAEHEALRLKLEEDDHIEMVTLGDDATVEEQIRRGRIEAAVALAPPQPEGAGLPNNFTLQLLADSSQERSRTARQRVESHVEEYRNAWLERRATELSVAAPEVEIFDLRQQDEASAEQVGGFLLGLVLPLTFVIMVAIGCFNPAIDSTAGEKERQTWETTLTLATSRTSVMTAKYFFVVTFGMVAGLLNLAALTISMRGLVAPLLLEAGAELEFSVPVAAWPLLAFCAALLAGLIGAAMMIFAAFARTFREGQSMVMPVYLLSFLPALLLNDPGLELDARLALVPIGNVILLTRDLVAGDYPWIELAIATLVQLALIVLCVRLAVLILRFENVVTGSFTGNLFKFLRQRLRPDRGEMRRRAGRRGSHHE